MKKLFEDRECVVRRVYKQWKKVIRSPKNLEEGCSQDYSTLKENDIVRNECLGITTKKRVFLAREAGAIIYDYEVQKWRFTTKAGQNSNGAFRVCFSDQALRCVHSIRYLKKHYPLLP